MTDNDRSSSDKPKNPATPDGSTEEPRATGAGDGTSEPTGGASTSSDPETTPLAVPKYEPEPERKRGSISFQDENTTPREPTLAEQRARREALRREREAEEAEIAEAERKRTKRRRILIGTGVSVGVVAVVAAIYAAATPDDDEVVAHCVDTNGVVVDDDYCDDSYARSHGGYSSGGFIYIGGSSYRYNYGGTGRYGQKVTGGSYVAPSGNTSVKTSSGKTVQRGGLGVSSGGKSGGS
ncbi:hypothetical protein [Actinokineospora iranica]|uniref:Uncharacterized protein n=1 Tax=Actinokineospora iranica TaxID=1271860 RepID=A0A1G6P4B5_9PSEU|nr:hypothetical protein [Actinokineospora iranica]SDC75023.1 hypothetical protein SAMN05216174_104115 [Actinokineospora iranica]